MHVEGLDHLVLVVADVERSLRWYGEGLGLDPVRVEEWRQGAAPFPSVRVDATTLIDLVPGRRTGENVAHLCLVVDRGDIDDVVTSGRFDVVEGPGLRFGARGMGTAVYIRDPDGNVVELRCYP